MAIMNMIEEINSGLDNMMKRDENVWKKIGRGLFGMPLPGTKEEVDIINSLIDKNKIRNINIYYDKENNFLIEEKDRRLLTIAQP